MKLRLDDLDDLSLEEDYSSQRGNDLLQDFSSQVGQTTLCSRLLILLMDHHLRTLMLLSLLSGGARCTTTTRDFIHRRLILIRSEEDIPIGRLYRTHPGGPCRALTARKSVRPLSSHRLALRSTPLSTMYLPTTSESSTGDSSSESSAGPSRKRCGHQLRTDEFTYPATGALISFPVLITLPHRKEF
ncbi:hypothetical protein Tco_0608520 [Tanacetum coccineum]